MRGPSLVHRLVDAAARAGADAATAQRAARGCAPKLTPRLGRPSTGDRIEWMAIHIYTIRDGKVLENAIMRDELATMRRLGLVPSA